MTPSPWWEKGLHADRRAFLHGRVAIVRAVRRWFEAQGFVEVEPNALVASPGAEVHLDAFESDGRYLHTSPEFAMKKLLAAGEEKIFFLGKVWRRGETGPLHTPEFTMLEWYRAGEAYERVQDDCVALARVACEAVGAKALRWREKSCDPFVDAHRITVADALATPPPLRGEGAGGRVNLDASSIRNEGASTAPPRITRPPYPLPSRGGGELQTLSHDAFSARIVEIEPYLGSPALTLLTEYPITEAALARRCAHDPNVAERFEMYACGVELANGFGELTDTVEQRARLEQAMAEKQKRYGKRWPIDEDFLAALAHMAPASGCALGFDRLVMLATGARRIDDVLWTPQ